jgi:hypothetical protein
MKKKQLHFLFLTFFLVCSTSSFAQAANGAISDVALFAALNLDFPGMENVKSAVVANDYITAKKEYQNFRKKKNTTVWPGLNSASKPTTATPGYNTTAADRVLSGYIGPMSGFTPPDYNFNHIFNWKFNPVATTDPTFTNEWVYSLNRFNFWSSLRTAYWGTLDEKYAVEWVTEMRDWVSKNPVDLNSGAASNMMQRHLEMGLRMCAIWMDPYYAFLNSVSFTPDAHADFVRGVLGHEWRMNKLVSDFVSSKSMPSNREVIEAAGLGNAAILFPEFKESDKWLKQSFVLIDYSLANTIYPDGAENELAPGYAQWTLSYYQVLARTAKANNAWTSPGYIDKMKNIHIFNMYLQDPNGLLPPTNDSDPSGASFNEAYSTWGDSEFQYFATNRTQGKAPVATSYKFPWAGFNVMRSGWDISANYLFFKNGPIGAGHGHEDELNLHLVAYGKTLLPDPGSYTYDASEMRFYVTSTQAHNTISVDGKQQHRLNIPSELISTAPSTKPWMTSDYADYAAGWYDNGYEKRIYQAPPKTSYWDGIKDFTATHKRHVIFLKPYYYLVSDFLEGSGSHTYDANFNLDAPDAVINTSNLSVNSTRTDNANLMLWPLETSGLTVKSVKGQASPILGWIGGLSGTPRAIPSVIYSKTSTLPVVFSTLLYPYNTASAPSVSSTLITNAGTDIWACTGTTQFETFAVAIRRNGTGNTVLDATTPSAFTANADVSIVRKKTNDIVKRLSFYNLSFFTDNQMIFSSSTKASILIEKNGINSSLLNAGEADLTITFTLPFESTVVLPVGKWAYVTSTGIVISNGLPIVNAGLDINFPSQSTVSLSGSGISPDGRMVSYLWTKISGGNVTINSPNSSTTTVSGLVNGSYTFRLTVDDGYLSATDDVMVNLGNYVPISTESSTQIETEDYFNITGAISKRNYSNSTYIQGLDPGDALEYTIDVPISGKYLVTLQYGYPYNSKQTITMSVNNNAVGSFEISNTGSYTIFSTLTTTISLNAGKQILKLTSTNGANSLDWLRFTPEWISTVTDINENSSFSICPNPAINKLYINDNASNRIYRVYSLQGVKLIESANVKSIDISAIQSGVYLITNGNKALKFFKK